MSACIRETPKHEPLTSDECRAPGLDKRGEGTPCCPNDGTAAGVDWCVNFAAWTLVKILASFLTTHGWVKTSMGCSNAALTSAAAMCARSTVFKAAISAGKTLASTRAAKVPHEIGLPLDASLDCACGTAVGCIIHDTNSPQLSRHQLRHDLLEPQAFPCCKDNRTIREHQQRRPIVRCKQMSKMRRYTQATTRFPRKRA